MIITLSVEMDALTCVKLKLDGNALDSQVYALLHVGMELLEALKVVMTVIQTLVMDALVLVK